MERIIYLDNAATTRPLPDVVKIMNDTLLNNYGNPSSLHSMGLEAERYIKKARENLARAINAQTGEIFFTSGGTESNNWAIKMSARRFARFGKHLITTSIEHPSVLRTFDELEEDGFEVTYLPCSSDGSIKVEDLKEALREDTILVSLMFVNNEMGSILPVIEAGRVIAEIRKKKKGRFYPLYHVDAVQALGKIPVDVREIRADLMSFSAHKLHGPKGTGALFKRKEIPLPAFITGGEQEGTMRSGTENVPGIAGFGEAVLLAQKDLEKRAEKMRELKVALARGIIDRIDDVNINGPEVDKGAPHILNVSFGGIKAEILVHSLSREGIFVSTKSACSARKNETSHVLRALKLDEKWLDTSIRFSFSPMNTMDEIKNTLDTLEQKITELRRIVGGVKR